MKIAIMGGDGFVGWPTSLHLSNAGHEVHIIDNLSRRWIDTELGVQSLTPMDSIQERTRIWHAETGRKIHFHLIDLAKDYQLLKNWLAEERPDAIIHFAEQRAAPYSMKSDRHKNYTVNNNVSATHNLLNAMVEIDLDAHLVHLGTMGVYGYSTVGAAIPEGYLPVGIETMDGETVKQDILYPSNPGSIYHMTKCLDQLIFQFYAKNDALRITDLHQGIVWGTHTDQTRRHDQLVNRFDYDGDYGTVLNRFLIQAAIGYPLTVHGTGGQTRAFIHIQDSVRCIEIALHQPRTSPQRPPRVNRDFQPQMHPRPLPDMAGRPETRCVSRRWIRRAREIALGAADGNPPFKGSRPKTTSCTAGQREFFCGPRPRVRTTAQRKASLLAEVRRPWPKKFGLSIRRGRPLSDVPRSCAGTGAGGEGRFVPLAKRSSGDGPEAYEVS